MVCRVSGHLLVSRAMHTHPSKRALAARPLSAVAALIALFTLGNALVAGCGGKSNQGTATNSTPAQTAAPESTAATSAVVDGAQIYAEKCTVCQGLGRK